MVFAALLCLLPSPCRASESPAPPTLPQNSSSEIEQHVCRAVAFAYLNKPEDLEKEYLFFKGMDTFMKERGHAPTGLSDNLLDLMLGGIKDRDEFMKAQRTILSETPDEELRRRVNLRLNDDVSNANSLLAADRYNRFAFIFNTFVRPLSLLSVGYFPALIDSGVATLLNFNKLSELSVEEKKALVLYKQFLDRYPQSDQAELLRQRATQLDKKRARSCYERELGFAEEQISKNDFWQAEQHFKNALAYCPGAPEATEGRARARELEARRKKLKKKTLLPKDKNREFAAVAGEKNYRNILYGVATGDTGAIIREAEALIENCPESPYAPYALYAIAAAHDMDGDHEQAMEFMKRIAARHPDSHIGRRARVYLDDPGYNLRLAFQESKKQYGKDTTKYVALGPEFAKSNVILGSSRIITQGLQAFESLGTFNVIALLLRGVNSIVKNPVSDQEIIDSGINYLRRYPDSSAAPEVHLTLARAYAKRQNLSKAVYHFAASGRVSRKTIEKLREKAAKQYLDFADATDNPQEKIRCYETILDDYPHSQAAPKALDALVEIEKDKAPIFELDKATLAENPIIFKLTALHIGPHLLDGNLDNGELDGRGLYSPRRGKIALVFKGPKGIREETIDIDYPTYKGLMAFAEEIGYKKGLSEKAGKRVASKFPVELRGTVGDDGVFVYPRLKIKEYREKDLYLYK
jgi:tetratricopeptide (TPR) repeat protein